MGTARLHRAVSKDGTLVKWSNPRRRGEQEVRLAPHRILRRRAAKAHLFAVLAVYPWLPSETSPQIVPERRPKQETAKPACRLRRSQIHRDQLRWWWQVQLHSKKIQTEMSVPRKLAVGQPFLPVLFKISVGSPQADLGPLDCVARIGLPRCLSSGRSSTCFAGVMNVVR